MTQQTEQDSVPVRVGIAGWSYPDWDGYVYPPGMRGDKLPYLAQYVDTIEINSTFYRPASPRTAQSWVRQTADFPDFRFTAKLAQDVTHRGSLDPSLAKAVTDGFKPLVDAGVLTHILAQFKYDYADTPETRSHIEGIHNRFASLAPLTLELRHNSWQSPAALEFLKSLHVNLANLDYPTARDSFNLRLASTGPHAYLRLHGHNRKAWFSSGVGRDEKYNYLYSGTEIHEICSRAISLRGMSKSVTVIANNHYQGKEMVNALQIRAMLSGGKVAVPPTLAAKYPDLDSIRA